MHTQIKALGKSEVYDLYLDGLTSISEKAAKALANYNGSELSLKGLTSITEDEAKALGKFKVHYLYLDGLTSISEKAAKALANFNGQNISLKGLTTISQPVAHNLSKLERRFTVDQSLLTVDDLVNLLREIVCFGEEAQFCFRHGMSGLKNISNFGFLAADKLYFDQITDLDEELASLLSPLRRILSLRRVKTIDLNSLKKLMEAKVKAGSLYHKYYVFACLELGIESLDFESAAVLSKFDGQLSLPNLKHIDAKAASKLRGVKWNLLLGIETIDVETARALTDLPKKSMGRNLHFPNLKDCEAEALSLLALITPHDHGNVKAPGKLILGFEKMHLEQAKIIFSKKGGYDCVSLPNLRECSGEIFKVISESMDERNAYCRSVHFDSLERISAEQAQALVSNLKATWFSLNGLKRLESGVAEQLSNYKPRGYSKLLALDGIQSLTIEDAAHLGKLCGVEYLYLNGISTIDPAVAYELSKFAGALSFGGLKSICDDSAKELAKHGANKPSQSPNQSPNPSRGLFCPPDDVTNLDAILILDGLLELSEKAAEYLASHKGNQIKLDGLKELSENAAKALSCYRGKLSLDGLTELSDAAAEALSKHQGERLSLDGLTELSDAAAEALSKHQGVLWLHGLTELSDAAAEALCKHQ